jgi:hypothetical protein
MHDKALATEAHRSDLKLLTKQAHNPESVADDPTKAEASKGIDTLKGVLDRDRQGLVPLRGQHIQHCLVNPTALPACWYQDKGGHIIHP